MTAVPDGISIAGARRLLTVGEDFAVAGTDALSLSLAAAVLANPSGSVEGNRLIGRRDDR